jgi:hypothetical protein
MQGKNAMTVAAIDIWSEADPLAPSHEQRAAPRFFSLIRAAKLVSDQGEFICVVRDVSSTGVRLRCFHTPPRERAMALELQNGDVFEIERVREDGEDVSFRFATEVPIERLVQESAFYPRRPLRLNIAIPISLRTPAGPIAAVTKNFSQQGCRLEAALPMAIDQALIVESRHLPGIRAKVRWRRDCDCGLVFDDTFSLRDFAIHAARLQCPALAA